MKKILLSLVLLLCLSMVSTSTFAMIEFFTTNDSKFYCSDFMDDEFKLCSEFNDRILGKEKMIKVDNKLVIVDKKSFCIENGKEASDISKCDKEYFSMRYGIPYDCTIKNGEELCIERSRDSDLSYTKDNEIVSDMGDSDKENVDDTVVGSLVKDATCKVNGEIVPCDEMMEQAGGLMKMFGGVWIVGMILAIVLGIFWLLMLIDAIRHQKEHKILWIVVILFTNSIGAIVYYLVAKRPRNKLEQQEHEASI